MTLNSNENILQLSNKLSIKRFHESTILFLSTTSAVVSLLFAFLAIKAMASDQRKGLVAVHPDIDLGKIDQKLVQGSFDLMNTSSLPVMVLSVVKSCGCTEAQVTSKQIPPGAHVPLKYSWDATGRPGISGSSIMVTSQELPSGQKNVCVLRIHANVIPEFTMEPEILTFHRGVPETSVVRFLNPKEDAFMVVGVTSPSKAIRAEVRSDRNEVVVHFDPKYWSDETPFRDTKLMVTTTSQKQTNCPVPVNVIDGTAQPKH